MKLRPILFCQTCDASPCRLLPLAFCLNFLAIDHLVNLVVTYWQGRSERACFRFEGSVVATEAFTNLSAEKRQRILDKGVEIFTKYSYGEASTNQITKELGISKGSLFYYFGSKKDFYLYLLETSIQLLLPQDQSIAATDFYGIVFEALHRKLRLYEGGRKEHILFVSRGAKETHEEVKAEKDALIGRYFVQAQQGSQAVLKRDIDTLDIENPEKTERLLTGMSLYVDAIINRYLAFYRDDPGALFQNEALVRSEIKEYLDLLLYGVINDERH